MPIRVGSIRSLAIDLALRLQIRLILHSPCVRMQSNSMRRVFKISAVGIALAVVLAVHPAFPSQAADTNGPGMNNPFEGKLLTCTTVDGSAFHLQESRFKAVMGRSTLVGERVTQVGKGFQSLSASVYLPWDTVVSVTVHGTEKVIGK